mmetsp:Transcript_41101/g.96526  ORF Transcript_41101/g.96526 Transcript_41101/m.96526 type:complete len:200 (-) Transcript_41101:532-1131(-)
MAPSMGHNESAAKRACKSRKGANPSESSDQTSIIAHEVVHVQASNALGSNLALVSHVSTSCWKAALTALPRLARKHRAVPTMDILTSPLTDKVQPIITISVGSSSQGLNSRPISTVMNTVTIGVVAPTISAYAAEQNTKALLFIASEKANAAAIGPILRENSSHVGTGIAALFIRCLTVTRIKPTAPDKSKWPAVRNLG